MAMFLDGNRSGFNGLAPVQSTPFITGILGTPEGTDANGRRRGGGGVTSFGFASEPRGIDQGLVKLRQDRQWALTDSIGTSSAFDTRLDPTEVNLLASLNAWLVGADRNVEVFRGLYTDQPSG